MSGRLGGTNARDVRMLLQGKIDPEVVRVLADLAERQDHLFQLLGQAAHAIDRMADAHMSLTRVSERLKEEHLALKAAKAIGVKVESEAASDE